MTLQDVAHRLSRIPIVGMANDLVASGLVASMVRPGGNTTGVNILASELDVKRLEVLCEFVSQARQIAILVDPTTNSTRLQLEKAARDLGIAFVFRGPRPRTNRTRARRDSDALGLRISAAI